MRRGSTPGACGSTSPVTNFFRVVVDLWNHSKLPSALAGRSTREPGHGPAAYRLQ